jgi:hypothetical protein
MKQPPRENRHSHKDQPQRLVAPVLAPLLLARIPLGLLLEVRLDAGFDHGALLKFPRVKDRRALKHTRSQWTSIGRQPVPAGV